MNEIEYHVPEIISDIKNKVPKWAFVGAPHNLGSIWKNIITEQFIYNNELEEKSFLITEEEMNNLFPQN